MFDASLKRNWGWLFGLGLLFLILGCIGLGMVVGLTLVSILFLGIMVIIAGVAQLIDLFKSKHWRGAVWHALIALLYLVGGSLIIYDPILASTIITGVIAWILIVIGIARFTLSLAIRPTGGWVWLMLAGIMSIILGVLILIQWPVSALWVIGLFIALELIICGWSYMFLALGLRKAI